MKRTLALILGLMLVFTSFALADTYTLTEILPSISSYTDEELATLLDAVKAEQKTRETAQTDVGAGTATEESVEEVAIIEREDYVERPAVQRGDKGDEAQAVQEKLIELGFLVGTADGDFGKKSEAAVTLFQKANGLEGTGIADSITQYVMFSASAVDKKTYDNMPIATGDGWEMLRDYIYNTSWYHYYIFILKNTSGYNAEISANVYFYDAEDNLIGVSNGSNNACENGYETYWSFSNDLEFDHATVEITMSEETWYQDGGQSCVELTSNIVGKKAILSAKNNGSKPVEFIEYNVLFLNDNGEIVNTGWGYMTDADNELKPGAVEMREESSSKSFSSVRVYALGRINR